MYFNTTNYIRNYIVLKVKTMILKIFVYNNYNINYIEEILHE